MKTKRFKHKITMKTTMYLLWQEREMKEENKKIIDDTPTTFEEHVAPIMEDETTRNKLRQCKPFFITKNWQSVQRLQHAGACSNAPTNFQI